MTKHYFVKTVKSVADLDLAPCFRVKEDMWKRGGLEHVTMGRMVYIPGTGLVTQMTCLEQNPRTEVTIDDDEVCEDSCLEFFLNANPKEVDLFINCESNAIGALHAKIGPNRDEREAFPKELRPTVKAEKKEDRWSVTYTISEKTLETYYIIPGGKLQPGFEMAGNFYHCGDKTPLRPLLSWNVVETEKPDFHRPEWFGKLIIME